MIKLDNLYHWLNNLGSVFNLGFNKYISIPKIIDKLVVIIIEIIILFWMHRCVDTLLALKMVFWNTNTPNVKLLQWKHIIRHIISKIQNTIIFL